MEISGIINLVYVVIILLVILLLWYYGVFNFNISGKNLGKETGEGLVELGKSLAGGVVNEVKKIIPPPKKQGESCNLHTDCEGHMPGQSSLACDNGTCQPQLRDWAGVWYTPSECVDGPGRAAGTCKRGFSWPRKENQECNLHTDCEGYKPGQSSLACDNKTCKPQMRDWAGVWYTPSECVDGPGRAPGTCKRGFSWPRKDGQECILNEDCEGFRPGQPGLGCNKGVCAQMKRDWAGVYYNPYECRGGIFSGPGTC